MLKLAHSRPLACRVVELIEATPTIRIARLSVLAGGAFRFQAGQYARVALGEARPRFLSMANRPGEELLEFHLRHGADGGAAAFAPRVLRLGDHAWVEGPFGEAHLRAEHAGPILAIAGGSGLAPIQSIVEEALARAPGRPVALYIGAREEAEVYGEARFQRHQRRGRALRLTIALSAPTGATHRPVGTIVEVLARDLAAGAVTPAGAKVYCAGPPAMVAAATALLHEHGVALGDIHADARVETPRARLLPSR